MPRHTAPASPVALRVPAPSFLELIPLTKSERRVASLLAWGWSNKEIAQILDRSEATVKNQVAGILRKTGAVSRSRFIVFFHTGQLEPQFSHRDHDQAVTEPTRCDAAIAACGR